MKPVFVKTSNYERFNNGMRVVEGRGAMEASMMLVMGRPGYGKSEMVERWSIQNAAIHLRAPVNWTPTAFMKALAEELRLDSSGFYKDIRPRVTGYLGRHQDTVIVIDELDNCMDAGAAVLEAVRDITDLTEIIVILVGMEHAQSKLSRYPQIMRRISSVVHFQPATLEDVRAICTQKAEVEISEDLIREIHTQSRGLVSEIVNAIRIVERQAALNEQKKITLADMKNRDLILNTWQAARTRPAAGVK